MTHSSPEITLLEKLATMIEDNQCGDLWDMHDISEEDHARLPKLLRAHAQAAGDWRDDPSADERWNAGVDFVMKLLCDCLGVKPDAVTWDAATETIDGDVSAVIGNILRAKYGEDWSPAAASKAAPDPDAWMREDGSAATINPMIAAGWKAQGGQAVPLYAAPPQAAGEPVGWLFVHKSGEHGIITKREVDAKEWVRRGHEARPVYFAPPQPMNEGEATTALREAHEHVKAGIKETRDEQGDGVSAHFYHAAQILHHAIEDTPAAPQQAFDHELVNSQCKLGDYCKCCAGKPQLCPNYEGPGAQPQGSSEPKPEWILLAHEIREASKAYRDGFGEQGNADRKAKLERLLWNDKGTFAEVLEIAARAQPQAAPAISRADLAEVLANVRQAIATILGHIPGSVPLELHTASVDIARAALSRPPCGPSEKADGDQS